MTNPIDILTTARGLLEKGWSPKEGVFDADGNKIDVCLHNGPVIAGVKTDGDANPAVVSASVAGALMWAVYKHPYNAHDNAFQTAALKMVGVTGKNLVEMNRMSREEILSAFDRTIEAFK